MSSPIPPSASKPSAANIPDPQCAALRRRLAWIIAGIVVLDQAVKLWIKTHLTLGDEIFVFDWFRIHFTENYGIAFGIRLFGRDGKVAVTLTRIIVAGGLLYLLWRISCRATYRFGFKAALAMIAAGAIGNIIDSVAYGVLFGYDTWFHGRVVDMFFFPIVEWQWPEWLPLIGGERFLFFQYIFNVADSALTIGVLMILIFYTRELKGEEPPPAPEGNATA